MEPEEENYPLEYFGIAEWESLRTEELLRLLQIQRLEGEARQTQYHEKLDDLKLRQEALQQRRIARLKTEGINLDLEAIRKRLRSRKRSAWGDDEEDEYRRRLMQQKIHDDNDEDSIICSETEYEFEDDNHEGRNYADWYAQHIDGRETRQSRSIVRTRTRRTNVIINGVPPNAHDAKTNAMKTVGAVVGATNYLEGNKSIHQEKHLEKIPEQSQENKTENTENTTSNSGDVAEKSTKSFENVDIFPVKNSKSKSKEKIKRASVKLKAVRTLKESKNDATLQRRKSHKQLLISSSSGLK